MKTVMRKAEELRVHPAVAGLPELGEQDETYLALVRDIMDHGWQPGQEVLVTPDSQIIDGRHRVRAAKRLGIEVPTVVVEADEDRVLQIAAASLAARRHYTKGQLALAIYPSLANGHERARKMAAESRKRTQFGHGQPIQSVDRAPGTETPLETLAKTIGVSTDTLHQAGAIWELWKRVESVQFSWTDQVLEDSGLEPGKDYTMQEVFWPKLMRSENPIGLGRAYAGMQAVFQGKTRWDQHQMKHGGGRPTSEEGRIALLKETLAESADRWRYYAELPDKAQKTYWEEVKELAQETESESASGLAAYYLKLSRIYGAVSPKE